MQSFTSLIHIEEKTQFIFNTFLIPKRLYTTKIEMTVDFTVAPSHSTVLIPLVLKS